LSMTSRQLLLEMRVILIKFPAFQLLVMKSGKGDKKKQQIN